MMIKQHKVALREAEVFYQQGRFFDAMQLLLTALSHCDKQADSDAAVMTILQSLLSCLFALDMGYHAVPHVLRLATRQEKAAQFDDALQTLQSGINHDPQSVQLFLAAGLFQQRRGRLADAQRCLERALSLDPTFTPLYNHLGIVLQDRGLFAESAAALQKAIARQPDHAAAWLNLGTAQMQLCQPAAAERSFRRALALNPDYAHARSNLGMCLLWQGKAAEGWAAYEARHQMPVALQRVKPPAFPVPRWQGEPLAGKRVLIWPEQGLGDQIMCAAWLQALKERAQIKQLVLVCAKPLLHLFASLKGPDVLVGTHDAMPLCDVWLGAMSVPHALGTEAASVPRAWLTAEPQWLPQALHAPVSGLRVGLCWKGSEAYPGDERRSFALQTYDPLLQVPGVSFMTLLPGTRDMFLPWAGERVIDPGHEIDAQSPPFAETAAAMMSLDLIITSDTSIAHLALALGRPVWLLLQFAGEWRWSVHPMRDSGLLRVFRQSSPGDWQAPLKEICRALSKK